MRSARVLPVNGGNSLFNINVTVPLWIGIKASVDADDRLAAPPALRAEAAERGVGIAAGQAPLTAGRLRRPPAARQTRPATAGDRSGLAAPLARPARRGHPRRDHLRLPPWSSPPVSTARQDRPGGDQWHHGGDLAR
jgi:hypothetical protein